MEDHPRLTLRLNKVHFPVTVLGHGRRIGIWFQGCTIGCSGCVSRDTWSRANGELIDVAKLVSWISQTAQFECDGLTISGGEPFQQPEALAALLAGARAKPAHANGFDILCYSGYSTSTLRRRFPHILAQLDAVVSGPFRAELPSDDRLLGSSNQELICLSAIGRERYADRSGGDCSRPAMQVSVAEQQIWYIGIPRRGDLERIELAAAQRGVSMRGASWRA